MSSRPSRLTSQKHTPQTMLSPPARPAFFQANSLREPGTSRNLPLPSLSNSTLTAPEARNRSGQPSLLTSAAATPRPGRFSGRPAARETSSNFSPPLLRKRREFFVFEPL